MTTEVLVTHLTIAVGAVAIVGSLVMLSAFLWLLSLSSRVAELEDELDELSDEFYGHAHPDKAPEDAQVRDKDWFSKSDEALRSGIEKAATDLQKVLDEDADTPLIVVPKAKVPESP